MATEIAVKIPHFINNETFRKYLVKDLGDRQIQVSDTKASVTSKPGDNYSSTIYAVTVTYTKGNAQDAEVASFIVKRIIDFPDPALMERYGSLEKEVNFYNILLPKFNAIAKNIQFSPKCYGIFRNPNRNFIFEDMIARGYTMGDREVGLDEAHIRVALNKIAEFHATSMELVMRHRSIDEKFKEGFCSEFAVKQPIFRTIFGDNIRHAAEMVETMPEYERFAAKLIKLSENLAEIVLKAIKFDNSKDIKVLNHGDLWVNNFLYKYDEETHTPLDVVFVDYQGTFFNNPGVDINNLFTTSATLEVLKRKQELIEECYYPSFVDMLKKLNFGNIPSLDMIRQQIHRREIFTILGLFGALPLISMDREESKTNSFEQFSDKKKAEEKRAAGMGSQRFRETMKYLLVEVESVIDDFISKF